jgi:IS605 OrfB family transposase
MITLSCLLEFENKEDKEKVLILMRRYSSCVRFCYNRLLENHTEKSAYHIAKEIFPDLTSSWINMAIQKARAIKSTKKGNFIFGGRKLFEKLKKKHITGKKREELKKEWRERRQGRLYSIGSKTNKGNRLIRFENKNNEWKIRITVGKREFVYAKVIRSVKRDKDKWIDFIWRITQAELTNNWFPYTVGLKLKDGKIYAFISFEEVLPQIVLTKNFGVIGIDTNASPLHIAWTELSSDGNLIEYGAISMHTLLEKKTKDQRKDYLWKLAHQIVEIAYQKSKAIAIEKLNKVKKGYRGDGKRKLRRRLSKWIYKNLLDKIKVVARRRGIEVVEVNPFYTSIIGMLKYSPNFLIDKDIAGAYVIGRRALGFKERLPKNYKKLLSDKEYLFYSLNKLEKKKEKLKTELKQEENIYKRRAIKKDLSKLIKDIKLLFKSLESEPSIHDGANQGKEPQSGRLKSLKNTWQVLKVAVAIPLLGKSFTRDFSPLRYVLVSGDWKRIANMVSSSSEGRGDQSLVI